MINRINTTAAVSAKSTYSAAKIHDAAARSVIFGNRPKLSDEELEAKIMELARRDVASGKNSRFVKNDKGSAVVTGTDEWYQLMNDYTFAESPDRKSIINNNLSLLASRLRAAGKGVTLTRSPLYYGELFEAIMRNSTMFGSKDIGVNFINFKGADGTPLAIYSSDTGWGIYATSSEKARGQEFLKMWDNAIILANQEVSNAQYTANANEITDIGYM